MTRRKQSKPRALVKVDGPNENGETSTEKASMNANDINEKSSNNLIKKEPELEIYNATNEEVPVEFSDGENSFDSFSSELYSSQTSSSFPASDGTVNSYIGGKSSIRKDKSSRSLDDKTKKNGKPSSSCSYQCQFCDKSFPRLGYLKKHEQSHEEHMPFKCDYCARLFKHKRSRDRHTKLHTGDRRYKCLHCESAFSRSDHLKIHMKTHDNQKPFQCTVCNRGYNTAAALTSHMQNHKKLANMRDGSGNGSMYNYSPRSTSSLSSSNSALKRKRYESRIQRSELQTPQLKCGFCTKTDFQSTDELNVHIITMHNNDVSATEQHNHFRQHQQEQHALYENLQISCEFCTMKFETIKKMFHHIKQSHVDRIRKPNKDQSDNQLYDSSKSQRYEIDLIDSNWKNDQTPKQKVCDINKIKMELDYYGDDDDEDESMALENEKPTDLSQPKAKSLKEGKIQPRSNHLISNDIKTNDTPSAFMCNQCEASLPDFESFRLHLRSHLDQYNNNNNNNNNNNSKGNESVNVSFPAAVSNLICLQCGLTLENQADFEYHTEQHFIITNAEYLCETCNKSFPKLEDLQNHLNEIHIQYKCSICQEMFETKTAINLHFSLKHTHEIKMYRCSVCLDVFQLEKEFKHHIRTRHLTHNTIQCVFCRVVCSSEIEMHFHLATHVKQFRCPACSESFHVEFLLDRHLQLHHAHKDLMNEPKLQTTVHANKINENSYNQMIKSSNFYNYQITNKFYNTPLPTDKLRHNSFTVPRSISTMHSNNSFDSFKSSPNLYLANAEQATKSSAESDSDKTNFLYGHHVNSLLAKVRNEDNATGSSTKNALLVPSVGLNLHIEKRYHQAMIRNIYEKSLQKTNKNKDDVDNINNQMDIISNLQNPQKNQPVEQNGIRLDVGEIDSRKPINTHNSKSGVSLKCAYCSGDFRSRTELENHMKIQHNIGGKHKCLICDEILPSPAVLAEHKLTHCKVGAPGKCSHCMKSLSDANVFKQHLNEHNSGNGISKHKTSPYELPVECIVCRQVLSSEFEITLHAKFHTKSFDVNEEQRTCALCLEPLPVSNVKKICDSCIKKHNFSAPALLSTNFSTNQLNKTSFLSNENKVISCNLCKNILLNAQKLQEHLIEHTFRGTNGYICYICSSIFTSALGLQQHIQEHEKDSGNHIKPYECNLCNVKYFFRTELEHHQLDHEAKSDIFVQHEVSSHRKMVQPEVKIETKVVQEIHENLTEIKEDDDEYIEVEKVSS